MTDRKFADEEIEVAARALDIHADVRCGEDSRKAAAMLRQLLDERRAAEKEMAVDHLNQMHAMVAQMCETLGLKRDEVPCDAWTLNDAIVRATAELAELRATVSDYLDWCRRSVNAGPVGNPNTHAWHNQRMRDAIAGSKQRREQEDKATTDAMEAPEQSLGDGYVTEAQARAWATRAAEIAAGAVNAERYAVLCQKEFPDSASKWIEHFIGLDRDKLPLTFRKAAEYAAAAVERARKETEAKP